MTHLRLVLTSLTIFALGFSSSAYCQSQGIVADFVMTLSRQLPDGTQTENSSFGEYSLDREGRMRIRVNGIEVISDPVAGLAWRVLIAKGVASQSRTGDSESSGAGRETVTSGDSWSSDYSVPQPNWPTSPEPVIEDLPDRTINGIVCNGKSSRISLPAGTVGNGEALVIETETWTSNAFGFKIPVMVTMRNGTTSSNRRELRNVRASNFSAAHFRPDARYTIVEED